MQELSATAEAPNEWNRIFEILRPPSRDRIQSVRRGYQIQAGDFGWASPRAPKDKEGMVHLTGYDEKLRTIWYAELELSEVRYVGPKPTEFAGGKNPFPVKPPTSSLALYLGWLQYFFLSRWGWWKARHIRRENRLKYGKPKKESV
jgi:hypothetical protein